MNTITVTFHFLVDLRTQNYGHVFFWEFPLVEQGWARKNTITVTFLGIDAQGLAKVNLITVTFHFSFTSVDTITVTFLPINAQGWAWPMRMMMMLLKAMGIK